MLDGATAIRQLKSAVASPRLTRFIFSAHRGFHPQLHAAATAASAVQSKAIAAASQIRNVAMITAGTAFANGEIDASHTQADSMADANETLTNALAHADATYTIAAVGADTVLARSLSFGRAHSSSVRAPLLLERGPQLSDHQQSW
ncbi:MAG TPA: hypothetical protein PK992_07375 [Planctomycetaceae bacterium]|nr:hypothetical protein [Planctomycetaceae bacterium]